MSPTQCLVFEESDWDLSHRDSTSYKFVQLLKQWQIDNGYPFSFATEASVDLAADDELMTMMVEARF